MSVCLVAYTGKVRCDEDHEDVIEEEQHHQHRHHPHVEEPQPRQQHGDEGKPKDILQYPRIAGVPLHCPPQDHTHTEDDSDEEDGIGTILEDRVIIRGQPTMWVCSHSMHIT